MIPQSPIFRLPRDTSLSELAPGLERVGRLCADPAVRGCRSWLDTFDWRLFDAGCLLELVEHAGRYRVSLGCGDVTIETSISEVPRFVDRLPPGVLARRLAPLVEMRALLPQARMAGSVQCARLLDRRGKTTVRLELWRPPRRGDLTLLLRPVRGFDEATRAAVRRLRALPHAEEMSEDPLVAAAGALAVAPGAYPEWKLAGLDPDMRSDDALQALLAHYAAIMSLNLQGMLGDLDTEFLHDFRVGSRRSRALLRRMPGVFPEARIARFREDLAWLGAVTGRARDADVWELVFPLHARLLDAPQREALAPLMARLAEERRHAHAALVEGLDSARFRRRWKAWTGFLGRPAPRGSRQPAGPLPLAEVAARTIRRANRKVRRQGRAIAPDSPPGAYHDLRKSCKNLRYLIDAFGDVLGSKALPKATRRLKALQDLLGEHQDLDVHRSTLQHFHRQLAGEGALPGDTHDAMTRLAVHMDRRAGAVRERFVAQFERFQTIPLGKSLHRGRR
jgi:CHAD domain-containing protein